MGLNVLSDREFKLISKLVYDNFGINLTDQKRTLIIERLQKTLRNGQFNSYKDFYQHVISDKTGKELLGLVDRLSTNHTYFFREKEHLDFLINDVLPCLLEQRKNNKEKKLRIWSAGCSSGEEAYSIAIILKEFFKNQLDKWDIGILATDIATSVLEKALAGVYAQTQLEYMPPALRKRYFKNEHGNAVINNEIKNMVLFRRLNLMNSQYPFKGMFDVVFCRNVMIYFDKDTRDNLVAKFYRYIEKDGHLFIGHSESLSRENRYFEYIRPAIYRKK